MQLNGPCCCLSGVASRACLHPTTVDFCAHSSVAFSLVYGLRSLLVVQSIASQGLLLPNLCAIGLDLCCVLTLCLGCTQSGYAFEMSPCSRQPCLRLEACCMIGSDHLGHISFNYPLASCFNLDPHTCLADCCLHLRAQSACKYVEKECTEDKCNTAKQQIFTASH